MTTAEKLRQARARQAQAWRDLEEAAGIVLVTGARRAQIEAAALRYVNARHQTGRLEKHAREADARAYWEGKDIERPDQEEKIRATERLIQEVQAGIDDYHQEHKGTP